MPSVGDPGLPVLLEQIVERLDREVLHGAVLFEGEHAQLPMGGGVEVDRHGFEGTDTIRVEMHGKDRGIDARRPFATG